MDYLCGGKGLIPYEKIRSHEDLDAVPEGDFFSKTELCSSLKNEIIDYESYERVKKFWNLLRLKKLSELNDIYNFQDTIILCEIFENRAIEMMKKFPCNRRKCTSASFLSRCIHRFLSRTIIALPTRAEIVNLFEQTLIGGFSCVNTRLGFDSKLLLPKNSDGEPKENLKIIYNRQHQKKKNLYHERICFDNSRNLTKTKLVTFL